MPSLKSTFQLIDSRKMLWPPIELQRFIVREREREGEREFIMWRMMSFDVENVDRIWLLAKNDGALIEFHAREQSTFEF